MIPPRGIGTFFIVVDCPGIEPGVSLCCSITYLHPVPQPNLPVLFRAVILFAFVLFIKALLQASTTGRYRHTIRCITNIKLIPIFGCNKYMTNAYSPPAISHKYYPSNR